MRILLTIPLVLALGVPGAFAQAQRAPAQNPPAASSPDTTGNSALKDPTPNSDRPGAAGTGTATGTDGRATAAPVMFNQLESGANSFTEGQARSRLEGAGFSSVSGLAKDDNGIWRGQAQHNGKQVTVGLDYKGNVGMQ